MISKETEIADYYWPKTSQPHGQPSEWFLAAIRDAFDSGRADERARVVAGGTPEKEAARLRLFNRIMEATEVARMGGRFSESTFKLGLDVILHEEFPEPPEGAPRPCLKDDK